ncbi:MAG: carbon starvation protein A [Phycisphaerales bacterium]|nr:MAG: carbon starvation protein A [Phycisphaerales bacterium]
MNWLQNSLFITLIAAGSLYMGYKVYGRFLARRVLGFEAGRKTPAVVQEDGRDFVPTHPAILFGHHFASIAGLGPIVGPAIAVFWGWLPALLWVLIGSIFMGGVHDMCALYASLRHHARTIGDLTNDIIGPRARILFLLVIFFLLAMAMGVFALLMSTLFTDLSPQAVVPTFSLIAIAVVIGLLTYRRGWKLAPVTALGVCLMFAATFAGLYVPVPLYKAYVADEPTRDLLATDDELPGAHGVRAPNAKATAAVLDSQAARAEEQGQPEQASLYTQASQHVRAAAARAKDTWTYVLLVYAFAASVIPVWLLLQPRDYINSYQLYIGSGLLVLGLVVWHPQMTGPAVSSPPASAGGEPLWPILFITVACGAISGFHNLVSSGTTARQIRRETDACVIGYGAMLTEGFLAVLVIMACAAGLTQAQMAENYGNWKTASSGGLQAFLTGAGTIIAQPFVPLFEEARHGTVVAFTTNFIAVVAVSFAMTTLDSATRLLRYNIEAFGKLTGIAPLRNRYVAALIAVAAIGYFALIKLGGKPAGITLWQLFGVTNQLLAALGLLVVSVYLHQLGKPVVYTAVPMVVMFISVGWAMVYKLRQFYAGWRAAGDAGNASLFLVGLVILVLTAWMIAEAIAAFSKSAARKRA